MKINIHAQNHGSITLLVPQSRAAKRWLKAHTTTEPWQWFGDGLAVEPRMAQAILTAAAKGGAL